MGYVRRHLQEIYGLAEWKAMMYGTYRAMPEDEKQQLHEWEREYVDGSGRFATSELAELDKYIGKPQSHN